MNLKCIIKNNKAMKQTLMYISPSTNASVMSSKNTNKILLIDLVKVYLESYFINKNSIIFV